MAGTVLLTLLNVVVIVVAIAAVLALVMSNNCSTFHPLPTRAELAEVDITSTYRMVYALNVLSNLIIAIPGLMMVFLGFPAEGGVLLLTAAFSAMWHASGEKLWSVLDWIFAALSAVVMLLTLLRIVQVRGWPEFSAYFLVLPFLAMLAWGGFDTTVDSTSYINGRVAHMLWHVLNGTVFIMIALELMRTPALLPSEAMRNDVLRKDVRMWKRVLRWHRPGERPPPSTVYGLFRDLGRHGVGKVDAPRFH